MGHDTVAIHLYIFGGLHFDHLRVELTQHDIDVLQRKFGHDVAEYARRLARLWPFFRKCGNHGCHNGLSWGVCPYRVDSSRLYAGTIHIENFK